MPVLADKKFLEDEFRLYAPPVRVATVLIEDGLPDNRRIGSIQDLGYRHAPQAVNRLQDGRQPGVVKAGLKVTQSLDAVKARDRYAALLEHLTLEEFVSCRGN
jgi:hypothetical protein